uniref:non-specific serine/threonine protein kinase n=1 Tax=Kalanchoe fedtschenkoi TaxID=63787 RepID=A0A7N0VCE8_KALFE
MAALRFCLFTSLLFFSFPLSLSQNATTCHPDDLQALRTFLTGIGYPWSFDNNSASSCCDWIGVTCDSFRVTKIELPARRLSGKLSSSIGSLPELRTLNLSTNFLRGSLPDSLFTLQKLELLDLSENDLSGPSPSNVSLPEIRFLDVTDNRLDGEFPEKICGNGSKLRALKMADNYLVGSLGAGIGNCALLQDLCLGSNMLTGELPAELFGLKMLTRLSLQDNRFTGGIGADIVNLSALVRLDVSQNLFRGNLPDVFGSLPMLHFLVLHSNGFNGSIPFSVSNSPSMRVLNLRNNSFAGDLKLNCSAMTSLESLDLGSNQFHGLVPGHLAYCRNLTSVNMARNNFIGGIPESFKEFQSLSYLSISNASLQNISGALQVLQNCKNLTTLVLTLNFFGEELPSDSNLHFEKLRVLIIASCRLMGSAPLWLKGSAHLQLLDLSWNRLSGVFPDWFGYFESLFYLDVSNNSFSGEIPKSLTGLKSLITGNISLEEISPDFPFFIRRNRSARGLQYNQVWSFPPTLSLSLNNFTGPIWPQFGNLRELHFFDLKHNYLSGSIPSELSGMASLESMDLSYNNLTGIIPQSFVKLSFMSKFSVAYNQLHGMVPSRGQFLTFPNSSFEGNPGLCGEDHSLTPCPTHIQQPRRVMSNNHRGRVIGISVGVGFGTVLVIALGFIIVLNVRNKRAVAHRKGEIDVCDKESENFGSRSVILFENTCSNKEFSIDDLLKSTNNFDQENIIGCGGFGLVYKATLPNGKKVAIKRLSGDGGQMEREFHAEVEALSRAQHPNLVHLQGYCIYRADRLLIYSFMENNSLDFWLHEKPDGGSLLNWETRVKIAQGATRGLAYLHLSCQPHIVHRDIKSSNILLDENFEAHLADFGLARLIFPNETHVTTDLVGTLGYIPPEYSQASVATCKGDVYSLGVVLVELVTGKRPMDMCKPRGCRDLVSWVFEMKRDKKASEVFDPFIYEKQNHNQMMRVLEIACACLSACPKVRPSTQQLVTWLDSLSDLTVTADVLISK